MFEVSRGQVALLTGSMRNEGTERRRISAKVTVGVPPRDVKVLRASVAGGLGGAISSQESDAPVTNVDVRGSYLDPGASEDWEVEIQILADTLPGTFGVWSQSVSEYDLPSAEISLHVTGEPEVLGDLVIHDFGWESGS